MKTLILTALLPLLAPLIAAAPAALPPCDNGLPPAPPAAVPISAAPPPAAAAPPSSTAAAPAPEATLPSPEATLPSPSSPLAEIIRQVAPDTASCDGASKPLECRTADQAAPLIEESWSRWKITNVNERAGTIALMLFESLSFKYAKNLARPTSGQGTRNMQMAPFNLEYAQALFGHDNATLTAVQDDPDKVLSLVNNDDYGFGSAAWFLTAKCTAEVREQIATGSIEGWHAWMEKCIVTTNTKERDEPFLALQKAMATLA